MKEIPLTRGMVALVSDEDFDRVSQYKWTALESKRTWYAVNYYRDENGKVRSRYLHRLILDAPNGTHVDHINGDGLDNQRENIRLATRAQNGWNARKYLDSRNPFKGVHQMGRRHYVCLSIHGAKISFGGFDSSQEAARVYDAIVTKYRGDFAVTNFPDIDPAAEVIADRLIEKKGLAA